MNNLAQAHINLSVLIQIILWPVKQFLEIKAEIAFHTYNFYKKKKIEGLSLGIHRLSMIFAELIICVKLHDLVYNAIISKGL